jgi:flagella basal body P-ring formation protein FlgA
VTLIRFLILTTFIATSVFAAETDSQTLSATERLSSLIRVNLMQKIQGAEVRIPSLDKLMNTPPMSNFAEVRTIRLVTDKSTGVAQFEVIGTNSDGKEIVETIQTPYEAWKKVPVATHRIYPNSKLKNEDFKVQDVNVASGVAREFRGVMMPEDTNFNQLQTKQTILEGQYVVTSAIQRTPDLRKGDTVRLELNSGDLSLTTQAVTEEAGSVGSQVRVMTTKTKRELTGMIKEDHSVEVNL